jgi:DNA-binding beta-propeller fold protein YncE
MVAGAALLGMLLSFMGGAAAHAAGCPQSPCAYVDASVLGRDPAVGRGVFRFPQAIAFSPGGTHVFVADQYSGVVQKFDRQGRFVSQLGWFADAAQLGRLGAIGGLATDRNSHLYVLDSQWDRVQVFRSDTGAWVGAWGGKGGEPGRFDLGSGAGGGGIAVHQADAGTAPVAFVADENNHRIQRFTLDRFSDADPSGPVLPSGSPAAGNPNHVPTPIPDRAWGTHGDCSAHGCGQPADEKLLNFPQGIAVNPRLDTSGRTRLYVADDLNHRVVEFTADGTYLGEVGGFGTAPGQFRFPLDVGVDQTGHLFVADASNQRIQRFDASNLGFVGAWGGLGSATGELETPRALATAVDDPAAGVYVADSGNHRIQGFDHLGTPVVSWGIAGRGGPGFVTKPGGLAVDRVGNVYIGDTSSHRIEKLSGGGIYLDQWGNVIPRTGFTAPAAANGQFHSPRGVAYDSNGGNIWVADTANNRVQALTVAGTWLTTVGGPVPGGALGEFSAPRALAVGPDGDLYVADTGNNRIQRRDSSGSWSPVSIGTPLDAPTAVAVDGSGTVFVADRTRLLRVEGGNASRIEPPTGTFNRPGGLWVTGNRLYVSDTGNSRVLRFDRPTGRWDAIGGEGPGLGSFLAPTGLATTADGRVLYVADQQNQRVQRFVLELPPAPRVTAGRGSAAQPARSPVIVPDRDRPSLRLRARLRQRAVRRRAVLVSINCTERCVVDASGKIMVRRSRRALPLRRTKRLVLAPGRRVTLALRLSRKVRRKTAGALARGRRVTAMVVVTGRDAAGNLTRDARRIRIRP